MKHSTKRVAGVSLALAAAGGLVATSLPGAGAASASDGSLVVTDKGSVRGVVKSDHREFQGIPYAAPPVGELRWGSPQPAKAWGTPRDASKPGNACAQNEGLFKVAEKRSISEDCLYVNVTTPRNVGHRRLPVMVYIHGSGFRNGAGALYRPTQMAVKGDVIVVTVNYRLGIFGFLDHPALDGGKAHNRSGNFGLEDQQAALRWVKRNAGAFGGDAGNMTVFGESAGGVSTCSQLTSPAAAGLFQRAIVQSGPCTVANWPGFDGKLDSQGIWMPRPRASAERQGESVAAELGCKNPATVAACLRKLKVEDLLPQSDLGFTPVYGGGGILPLSPREALARGKFAKVPVMYGMTRDEFRLFTGAAELYGAPPVKTEADYVMRVENYVGKATARQVLARYPVRRYGGSYAAAWSAVATDAVLARSVSDMGRALHGRVPAYGYEFADDKAPWVANTRYPSFPMGAFHASELQYQFDTDYFTGRHLTPSQQRLSDQMTRYWTRFARTGDPNGPGSPVWQQGRGTAQVLAPGKGGVAPIDFAREHQYDFWQSVV